MRFYYSMSQSFIVIFEDINTLYSVTQDEDKRNTRTQQNKEN